MNSKDLAKELAIEKLRGYVAQKQIAEDPSADEDERYRARLWCSLVESGLAFLDEHEDPVARLLLEAIYVYPARGNIPHLTEVLHISASPLYRRSKKALRVFVMALYGVDIVKDGADHEQ